MLTTRAQLSDVLAYSRAGNAWDFGADGLLAQFAADAIRSSPGLGWLIEGVATQLIANSQAGMTAPGAVGNTNAASAEVPPVYPGATVRKHTRATDLASFFDTNCGSVSVTANLLTPSAVHTASVWVWVPSGAVLTNVALSVEGGGVTGVGTLIACDLSKRDQWQRLAFATTAPATPSTNPALALRISNGAGVSIYSCCPQFEVGAAPTSHIPSSGSTVTRNLDALVLAGANFTAAIGVPTTGCVVVECNLPQLAPSTKSQHLATISDGNSNLQNRYSLYNAAGGASIFGYLASAGAAAQTASAGTLVPGTTLRAAMSWSGGTIAVSVNGGVVQGVVGTTPIGPLTELRIGNSPAGGSALNGRVRLVRVLPYAPGSTELRALSTVGT